MSSYEESECDFLPSIALNHLYTFIGLTIVSILLISSYSSYASTLQTIPEIEQLKNILGHIAAKGNELLTLVATTNSAVQTLMQLPPTIGHREYWIRICNDTSNVWIDGALGQIDDNGRKYKVFLPGKASTSGYYIGGYGAAMLECYMNGSIPQLNLGPAGGLRGP